tara:strand:+ start:190 stop:714 length:525 start_codon:yes stop_codon:yes gene_type:complete
MYCIKCGNLTNKEVPEGDNRNREVCIKCGYIHYENPKIVVGVLPILNDNILLCKRDINPGLGKWTVPSGFMELNESLEEGALRESKEEANLDIKILKLYCTYSLPRVGQVYFLYLGKILNDDYAAMDETSEVKLFKYDKIPKDLIAFSSVSFFLERYAEDYNNDKSFLFHSNFE